MRLSYIKELEFRTKDGMYKFSVINGESIITNGIFINMFDFFNTCPDFVKRKKTLSRSGESKFTEYVVFECIKSCGYVLSNISVTFNVGDYVKVINK